MRPHKCRRIRIMTHIKLLIEERVGCPPFLVAHRDVVLVSRLGRTASPVRNGRRHIRILCAIPRLIKHGRRASAFLRAAGREVGIAQVLRVCRGRRNVRIRLLIPPFAEQHVRVCIDKEIPDRAPRTGEPLVSFTMPSGVEMMYAPAPTPSDSPPATEMCARSH